ncbi:hypothetical protein N9A94_09020 [Akkermansiaceae bacterium]|nr:hypothetical protein [Akkermansiaceae bacterium]MDA7888163.1 hypothetical protein [Akkermansiaceae bacterium]MDB4537958.1 hypothetical protein [Akkermansiaceae bacterium]
MRLLPLLLLACSPLAAEVLTLTAHERSQSSAQPARSTRTITLAEGDVATVSYLSTSGNIDVTISGTIIRLGPPASGETPPVVAGPATLRLLNFNTLNAALATVDIKRKSDTPDLLPHQNVVIPNDGSGDHHVYLESSSDMVTWTSTQPGLFNSAATNRFFRVRIAKP